MNFLDAIQSRRSIRKFKSDPIPDNYIHELIESGRLAPSGINLQPTRYVVIKSEEAKEKLKECTSLPFVPAAPVIIACCIDTQSGVTVTDRIKELQEVKALDNEYKNKGRSMDADAFKSYLNLNAAIAIDHITLKAVDLGLGSCWVMMFDKEKVKELLELDDRYEVLALLPVGYPDQSPEPRPRLSLEEVFLKEI